MASFIFSECPYSQTTTQSSFTNQVWRSSSVVQSRGRSDRVPRDWRKSWDRKAYRRGEVRFLGRSMVCYWNQLRTRNFRSSRFTQCYGAIVRNEQELCQAIATRAWRYYNYVARLPKFWTGPRFPLRR